MKKNGLIICLAFVLTIVVLAGCAKEKTISEKTNEYSLNKFSFELYESWILDNSTSDEENLTFVKEGKNTESAVKDTVMIQSKTIPAIMKIDTGDGGIKTKEDVVKKYSYGISDSLDLTFSEWKTTNGVEYCEQYFEYEGKLADGSNGNRYGREIVVPINGTEAYFIAVVVGDAEADLNDLDVIVDSLHETLSQAERASVTTGGESTTVTVPIATTAAISLVEKAFTDATTMTINDLTRTNGRWTYQGLQLLSEDEEWVNNTLNKKGTVNQGAIYRKIAMLLEGFNAKLNDYHTYAQLLLGFIPDTRDEFAAYASKLERFICTKDQLKAIMHALEESSNVQGSFDYNTNNFGAYTVKINNVSEVARELQITEEMFGYVLAELTEYGVSVSFSQEQCTLSY